MSGLGMGLLQATAAEDPPTTITLLAYGDSLIHGYGLPSGKTLPEQLEQALREEGWRVKVVNGGNSGDTTASGLARLDWTLGEHTDAVLLSLGANDGLRGLSPQDTEANLRQIIERLQARDIPVLLAGMMAPRNLGPDYAEEFDPLYPRLAQDYALDFTPFLLEGVALVPELNQADGIHPNPQGVEVIVETLMPATRALLRDIAHRQAQDPS